MAMSPAEKSRRYRDRKRGGPPRQLKPHGTRAAVRRHERAGEPPCAESHPMADDGPLYTPGDLDYPDGPRRGDALRARHDRGHLTGMYRLGKKAAGRDLDFRTWDEMPEAVTQ